MLGSLNRGTSRLGVRMMHQVPNIGLQKGAGLPGLFSAKGLDAAWFEYQHYLVTQLNKAIANRPELEQYDNLASFSTACLYSNDPKLRPVAALASQAYTNEFFFRSLRKEGSVNPDAVIGPGNPRNVDVSGTVRNMPPHPDPAAVEEASRQADRPYWEAGAGYAPSTQQQTYPAYRFLTDSASFGSVQTFRELLITRGDALFGNGAVWLVKVDNNGALVNTYGWGTPLSSQESGSEYDAVTSTTAPLEVTPVLGVNLWENIYLHDYGVAGKRQFLTNVFDTIDWDIINDRLAPPL